MEREQLGKLLEWLEDPGSSFNVLKVMTLSIYLAVPRGA